MQAVASVGIIISLSPVLDMYHLPRLTYGWF